MDKLTMRDIEAMQEQGMPLTPEQEATLRELARFWTSTLPPANWFSYIRDEIARIWEEIKAK